MDEEILSLLDDIDNASETRFSAAELRARHAWLDHVDGPRLAPFWKRLETLSAPGEPACDALLRDALARLARRRDAASVAPPEGWRILVDAYKNLPRSGRARAQILVLLARSADDDALARLVATLQEDPPAHADDSAIVLATLAQSESPSVPKVFPALLAGLANRSLAAAVLDLANYLTRKRALPRHPAADQAPALAKLLGATVDELERMHEAPFERNASSKQVAGAIGEGVALGVSLCDALGLIGDGAVASGPLHRALDLPHRRLKTEAAAALARLKVKRGEDTLVELAAEPVARLRVLAYADELGLTDRIPPAQATDQARAEAELATWLSEPNQFAVAPTRMELVDQREQSWPGYDEPVECWLFRFDYRFQTEAGTATYSNIGLAGPATIAVTADLLDLSPDDIYALYAGQQTEHEEIYELETHMWTDPHRVDATRFARRLHDAGHDEIRPVLLCWFFGDRSLVAKTKKGNVEGVAVVDAESILWFPSTQGKRSLGVNEAVWLHRGRRMLREFNG